MKKFIVMFFSFYYLFSSNIYLVSAKEINIDTGSNNKSNRIIVKYKNPSEGLKTNLSSSNNIKSVEKLSEKVSIINAKDTKSKERIYNDLKFNSNIEKVEEDKVLKSSAVINDPGYNQQWHIQNVNFSKLWDYSLNPKKTVIVAVIDSGIDPNHEDLQGAIVDGGYNFYGDNTDIYDYNGHGTAVSGVINASSNNLKGITGLGYNIPIKILPLKTSNEIGESYLSDVLRAINYAIEKKVDVINLSLGSYGYSYIENEEIQKAINSGIVVVASAGNDGNSSYLYPASYNNVISVGATDQYNNKTSFSNYNDKVSLTAPGLDILTTIPNGEYGFASGTSFSAPIVSATAAIMKSVRPDLTPQTIKTLLQNNTIDLGSLGRDNYFGYGKVDAYKVINSALSPQSIKIQPSNISININETSTLTATVSPDNSIDKSIIWSSSNNNIATVSDNGTVKGVSSGSATITAKTKLGNLISTASVYVMNPSVVSVKYQSYIQNIGWQSPIYDGNLTGTQGKGLRIEGLRINLENAPIGAKIKYQVHVQNIGWQPWVYDGNFAGTIGKSLRIEAIRIVLENAPGYTIAYQSHVQNIGWQDFVYNGNLSGTMGKGLRIEALRIKVVKAAEVPMGVSYSSHIQSIGWQPTVKDNELAGTQGLNLRMEAIKINLENAPAGAKIKYQAHVENIGWQPWVYNGALSGTLGKSLRIEAIRIVLENAPGYKIAYQAHVQNIGWQPWVYDGNLAGTTGKGLKIEAIRIKIVR
ncbi:MAG: S8 family serine peptidase [Clostridiaceae bacterium]